MEMIRQQSTCIIFSGFGHKVISLAEFPTMSHRLIRFLQRHIIDYVCTTNIDVISTFVEFMQRVLFKSFLSKGRTAVRSFASFRGVHTFADDGMTFEPPPRELSFQDYPAAYRDHSSWTVLRSLLILRLCRVPLLVNHAEEILQTSRNLFGDRLTRSMIRHSFFHHFCAGEGKRGAIEKARALHEQSVGGMLDCGASTPPLNSTPVILESVIGANLRSIKEAIEAAGMTSSAKRVAIKPTTLTSLNSLMNITASLGSVHGIQSFQAGFEDSIDRLKSHSIDEKDIKEFRQFKHRLEALTEFAIDHGVRLMIDAEESEIQPAIDLVVLSIMEKFNTSKAWIWTTYQCYLRNTYNRLVHDLEVFASRGKVFGVKLVRGAYMKHEQQRALELNLENPVLKLKHQTDEAYDQATSHLLEKIHRGQPIELCLATHNESSIQQTLNFLEINKMDPKQAPLHFAQLYGMSDYLTNTLAHHGYNSMKLLVYGDIYNIMPYLIRRAQENGDVLGGSSQDLKAMQALLASRLRPIPYH